MIYHQQFEAAGLGPSHRLILDLVPPGSRVIDLGCSSGYLAAAVRDSRDGDVLGIEMDPVAADLARGRGIEVIDGSILDPQVRERAQSSGPFDVVLAADILEHLADPGEVIDWIRDTLLARGGRLVASVPNVANYTIRKQLMLGRFDYTDHGLLDRTHLQFFTDSSLRELLMTHGFSISGWEIAADTYPYDRFFARMPPLLGVKQRLNQMMRRRFPNFVAFQFVFAASPGPKGRADGP